jgi:hypothetical protein
MFTSCVCSKILAADVSAASVRQCRKKASGDVFQKQRFSKSNVFQKTAFFKRQRLSKSRVFQKAVYWF